MFQCGRMSPEDFYPAMARATGDLYTAAEVRRIVFEEAAREEVFDRERILRRAAARLAATAEQIEQSLFADRPVARRVVAPGRGH